MTNEQKHDRTIMIVDDNEENIALFEALLSTEYNTRSANRGRKALEIAMETLPDLILLDIMMPEMNGYDVCRALKADSATKNIPVIFVTALLNPGDENRGFEAGGVDYITKPVNGEVVRSRIRAQLALRDEQARLMDRNHKLKKRLLRNISTLHNKSLELIYAEKGPAVQRGVCAECGAVFDHR